MQHCNAARTGRLPEFLLCAAVTVLLAACGGDGVDGSSEGSTATTAADSTTTTTTTDTGTDTTGTGTTGTGTTSTGTTGTGTTGTGTTGTGTTGTGTTGTGTTGTGTTGTGTTTTSPPTITGTPANTVVVGSSYSFQPTAASSDNGTLTFSIANKPSWATFNATTGQLSGTPASTNVGTDAGIVITVAEGSSNTALAAFTITVAAAAAPTEGTATLSWAAPTQNTDGTSITNLTGYTIAYGTSASALTQTVTVSGASATTYTVQNLVAGTWYFAISAVETGGISSALSSVVSTTIQ